MPGIKSVSIRGPGVTLVGGKKINEMITVLNALGGLFQVKPDGTGKIVMGDKSAVLDLTPLVKRVSDLENRLKNATISATCDAETSTITVTLTI